MFNRTSLICFSTGISLLVAKIAALSIDPFSSLTGLFPQIVDAFVFLALLWVGFRARNVFGERTEVRWRPFLLVTAGWLMTGFILTNGWVDYNLAQRTYVNVYDEPHKVWATRGLVTDGSDGSPERVRNSIASISYAFEQGARGTEVDAFYDPGMGRFVVSHGSNYKKRNGVLLTLDTLFDAVGEDGCFWLDWKKLRYLNRNQLQAALTRLKQVTDRGTLRDRVYVEGAAPFSLLAVRQADFQTLYDCSPMLDSNILSPVLVDVFKAVYFFGGFTVMGMQSGTKAQPVFGPNTRCLLRNIPMFIYHVPDDMEFLKELASFRNVRVIIIRQDINHFEFVVENS
jgi:hypothetical protein